MISVISKVDADVYVAKYNLGASAQDDPRDEGARALPLSGKNDTPTFVIAPIVSPSFTWGSWAPSEYHPTYSTRDREANRKWPLPLVRRPSRWLA